MRTFRLVLLFTVLTLAMTAMAQTSAVPVASTPSASTQPQPNGVRITHGPTIELAAADHAIVAWSTNVSSGTIVLYGTDANNLSMKAETPWGSLTHRVTLKKLQAGTQYYFQVVSGQAAGTGTEVKSDVRTFTTKQQ